MDYHSDIKKEAILPFALTWMDLEGIRISEVNQTERDKYCIISLICGIFKKKHLDWDFQIPVKFSKPYVLCI